MTQPQGEPSGPLSPTGADGDNDAPAGEPPALNVHEVTTDDVGDSYEPI